MNGSKLHEMGIGMDAHDYNEKHLVSHFNCITGGASHYNQLSAIQIIRILSFTVVSERDEIFVRKRIPWEILLFIYLVHFSFF